eukprot:m.59659 g.59659  ORF g.59659 m.59659 type:complete len:316 (+) comp17357_c0_seq2:2033-2980(+)
MSSGSSSGKSSWVRWYGSFGLAVPMPTPSTRSCTSSGSLSSTMSSNTSNISRNSADVEPRRDRASGPISVAAALRVELRVVRLLVDDSGGVRVCDSVGNTPNSPSTRTAACADDATTRPALDDGVAQSFGSTSKYTSLAFSTCCTERTLFCFCSALTISLTVWSTRTSTLHSAVVASNVDPLTASTLSIVLRAISGNRSTRVSTAADPTSSPTTTLLATTPSTPASPPPPPPLPANAVVDAAALSLCSLMHCRRYPLADMSYISRSIIPALSSFKSASPKSMVIYGPYGERESACLPIKGGGRGARHVHVWVVCG